jgi:hypothetical protein
MKVATGINAIVLRKTGNIAGLWFIRRHSDMADYTPNQGAI